MDKVKSYKIAFLVRDINYGGVAKMMTYYANTAVKMFAEVYVVVIGDISNEKIGLDEKIQIHIINKFKCGHRRIIRMLSDLSGIRQKINEIKPDVLLPFASGNVIYAYLAVGRKFYTVGAERGNPEELPLRLKALCRYIYPKCNLMLFQSEGAADFYFREKKGKCVIIPNPCMLPEKYKKQKNTGGKKGTPIFRIVSASRLASEKNIDIVIRAFNICKTKERLELYIYGDGPEETRLCNLIKELELSQSVKLCGKADDILSRVSEADIFVLVSSGEGMPNGLIEAMALGVPCITTNCMPDNTNPLVDSEVNGIIVPKRDIERLASAIDRLVFDRELYLKIMEKSLEIREKLSETKIQDLIKNVYKRILVEIQ